jgi:DNA-binding XRE family transcriptional regulator
MADTVNNEPARELEEMEDQRDAVTFMLARMEQANAEIRPWSVVERLHAGEHPVAVFRDLRGMTCDDLAAAAGVEPPIIAAIETFEQEGGIRLLFAIARALQVDLDDLVPWPGNDELA